MVGVGVIGAGYWGPKHVRNFEALPGSHVAGVADVNARRLTELSSAYPAISTTADYRELLARPDVDAVVVATPVSTHSQLACEALDAGKHVLVEKPLTRSSSSARQLVELAAARDRVLMVGHTFVYNPAVRFLHDFIQDGEIGDVYYANSQRLNLGLFQNDINVMWDLAPHDISILMYVLESSPVTISARGRSYVRPAVEDVAYLDAAFPRGVGAAIHVSWLDPNKVRRLTVVGSKKMVIYDDIEPLEKLRIYDKGVDAPPHTSGFGEFQLSYRYGAITIPYLPPAEPLRLECEHFLDCIRSGERPLTDGWQGLAVVEALEAAEHSLQAGGVTVPVWQAGVLDSATGLAIANTARPREADMTDLQAIGSATRVRP